MRNNILKKGFTLIEMLVVIAIISILAGVVLTGVGGFQAGARDSKRIADLQVVQNYLETYNNVYGHYPGTCTGTTGNPGVWKKVNAPASCSDTSLTDILYKTGSTVPDDPLASSSNTNHYVYAVNSTYTAYVLGTVLEKDNNQLKAAQNIITGIPSGYTKTTDGASDCKYVAGSDLAYCISS